MTPSGGQGPLMRSLLSADTAEFETGRHNSTPDCVAFHCCEQRTVVGSVNGAAVPAEYDTQLT